MRAVRTHGAEQQGRHEPVGEEGAWGVGAWGMPHAGRLGEWHALVTAWRGRAGPPLSWRQVALALT